MRESETSAHERGCETRATFATEGETADGARRGTDSARDSSSRLSPGGDGGAFYPTTYPLALSLILSLRFIPGLDSHRRCLAPETSEPNRIAERTLPLRAEEEPPLRARPWFPHCVSTLSLSLSLCVRVRVRARACACASPTQEEAGCVCVCVCACEQRGGARCVRRSPWPAPPRCPSDRFVPSSALKNTTSVGTLQPGELPKTDKYENIRRIRIKIYWYRIYTSKV